MRLALELIDRSTRSIARVLHFEAQDVAAISEALTIEPQALTHPGVAFELEPGDVAWLNVHLALDVDAGTFDVLLRQPCPIDDLPYEVHTGRELRLMLAGVKPLAVFADAYPGEPDARIFPEDVFVRYVEAGTFVLREYVELPTRTMPSPYKGARVLLYARTSEAWRIDAWIAMREAAAITGWNEGFERLEGSLLGYTHWQTEAYLQLMRRQTGHE